VRRGEHATTFTFTRVVILVALVVSACSGAGVTKEEPDPAVNPPAEQRSDTGDIQARGDCDIPEGQPLLEGDSVELTDLGEVNGLKVKGAVYPHPDYEGNPWSQWGQGIALADGRFFSAIGDHLGVDGDAYLYEYDPVTGRLTMVGDVLSFVDHVPGTWGYGKIHSQMVFGPCQEIYFSTYWGTFHDIEFEGDYTGDLLFRLDPYGRTMSPLDVPVEYHGQASLGAAPDKGLVYGEAVDPVLKDKGIKRGPLFAYDVVDEKVVFVGPDEPHTGYRSVLVDADGTAYYSIGNSHLAAYDPDSGKVTTADLRLPGEWLRAVTRPGPDGSVYGVTREPDTFFAMTPDGGVEDLGRAVDYTASLALAPDGSAFFYMPSAHGKSAEWDSPLISVDTATGEQTTVVELNPIVESALGYTVGGTYDVAISQDGSTIYMGVNANVKGGDGTFGEVILLVIELP
jgi:hypothetical protein